MNELARAFAPRFFPKSVLDICGGAFQNEGRSVTKYLIFMKKVVPFALLVLTLAACSAPHGKKYAAAKRELPPVALPPAVAKAEVFESQQGTIVALRPEGTLTVTLSSNHNGGYAWRLSEIPDPTVLKLVSNEYFPASPTNAGTEKWVFQAVGSGDVDVRLWYTSPRPEKFGTAPVFKCTVSVQEGLAPLAKGPEAKDIVPIRRPHAKSHAKPRVHPTVPDSETAPFLEPVFR